MSKNEHSDLDQAQKILMRVREYAVRTIARKHRLSAHLESVRKNPKTEPGLLADLSRAVRGLDDQITDLKDQMAKLETRVLELREIAESRQYRESVREQALALIKERRKKIREFKSACGQEETYESCDAMLMDVLRKLNDDLGQSNGEPAESALLDLDKVLDEVESIRERFTLEYREGIRRIESEYAGKLSAL